jgi:circadian clock protein KaiB
VSELFKGIALFTPGGDLIYCIDSSKNTRWHIHLCMRLQELLGLPELPHFLVPGYTATVDRWLNPRTKTIETIAELYPTVKRYQALLEKVFDVDSSCWQVAPWQEEFCNPIILETHRDRSSIAGVANRFACLWENHDLIIRLDLQSYSSHSYDDDLVASNDLTIDRIYESEISSGYVLRLFVFGDSLTIVKTLKDIHQLLEKDLGHPYTLKVIDVSKNPEQAEINRISATPALVRVWPKPVRRIVGDLNDPSKILQILTSF